MTEYLDEKIESSPHTARIETYFDEIEAYAPSEDVGVADVAVQVVIIYSDGGDGFVFDESRG